MMPLHSKIVPQAVKLALERGQLLLQHLPVGIVVETRLILELYLRLFERSQYLTRLVIDDYSRRISSVQSSARLCLSPTQNVG